VRVDVGDALALGALGESNDAPEKVRGGLDLDRQVEEPGRLGVVRRGRQCGRYGRSAVAGRKGRVIAGRRRVDPRRVPFGLEPLA